MTRRNVALAARPTVLACRLTEARSSKGWTQHQVAAVSGVAEVRVGDYERGRYTPTLDNLIRIADALDVTLDWLVGRSETPRTFSVGDGVGVSLPPTGPRETTRHGHAGSLETSA